MKDKIIMDDASVYHAKKGETFLENLSELWSFELLHLNTWNAPY